VCELGQIYRDARCQGDEKKECCAGSHGMNGPVYCQECIIYAGPPRIPSARRMGGRRPG
jgi:hypothetical protein